VKYLALHINSGRRRVITAGSLGAAKRKLPGRGIDFIVQPILIDKEKSLPPSLSKGIYSSRGTT
jgi:hypothetical protein